MSRWTKEEEKLLIEISDMYSNKELANIFNRGENSIEYKKGQLKLTKNVKNKDRGNQNIFENIDTEESAYWAGFIYADGYIIKGDKNYELGIELNSKDINHLNKINKIFNDYYKIKIKNKTYNAVEKLNNKPITNRPFQTCVIRIYSKKIVTDLENNGIVQNKTNSKIFPKIQDKEMFLHFLRGYIDGDGSYTIRSLKSYKYPQISIAGNNKYIFEYIINKLKEDYGFVSYYYKDRDCYKWQLRRKDDCLKLINLLYDNATIYLDRKFDKINEIKMIAV